MKKILTTLLLLTMVCVMIVGCGGSNTAQQYLDEFDQDELNDLIEDVRAAGIDLELTAQGDTLIYTLTVMEEMDEMFLAIMSEAMLEVLGSLIEDELLPEMREFGIENPAVRYVFVDTDGTVLEEVTFD